VENVVDRAVDVAAHKALGNGATILEVGNGALQGGASVLEFKVRLAERDYNAYKKAGEHIDPKFEGYDWRGDTFEEALKNRYQDMQRH
jgi:hypothetical protein